MEERRLEEQAAADGEIVPLVRDEAVPVKSLPLEERAIAGEKDRAGDEFVRSEEIGQQLVIEAVEDGGIPRTLYRGTVVRQLARGLIIDPRQGPIDIPLPPNSASQLRIRQVGKTRIWFWSIDELLLFER